jgi:beta-phosphoglucomutase
MTTDISFSFCRRQGIRAVIFDWDGVVVDSGQASVEAYQRIFREVGIELDQRAIRLREGQPTPELITSLLKQQGSSVTADELRSMVERRRSYDLESGKRRIFPSMFDLIHRLRGAGFQTAVVTGSSRPSLSRLLTPGLASDLDVLVCAGDVKRPKPDPEPFLLAASRLQISPAQCVVVENAPFGIQAALSAGCRVIGLCTTLSEEDLNGAHWIVRNHAELERLLSSSDETDIGRLIADS